MSDYTMCRRRYCPSRWECFRYSVHPSDEWQSFFAPPYLPIVDGKCEEFIANEKANGRKP